jgi:2-methylcitrate dehydratase PrpD
MESNPVLAFGTWLAEMPPAWPDAARNAAHNAFVDVISVIVPGALDPATERVFATVKDWGDGPATAFGMGAGLSAPWAALVNGTAAHALDFDDNFDPAKAHATAVLAPAILALAEQEGASGAACIDAYIAGLQIMGRAGQGVNPAHRNRGWHATATMGAIGAAAACARMLQLSAQQSAYALSISTSMAAGFMSQFGTMTKPLHAGLAAKAGVMAASLARHGITAGLDTFDAWNGINRLMVGPDYEALRDAIVNPEHGQTMRFETGDVGEPLLLLSSGLKVKRFPNCGSAHRLMDGFVALREKHGFTVDAVAEVHVRAPVSHLNNLMYTDPVTGPEAKFSAEYALAVLLLHGNIGMSDFTEELAARPEVRALYPRIHRHPVDKSEGEFPTEVEVVLTDGRRFETAVRMPAGSIDAPFTPAQMWGKYDACVGGILSPEESKSLRAALESLPNLPNARLLAAELRGPFAA